MFRSLCVAVAISIGWSGFCTTLWAADGAGLPRTRAKLAAHEPVKIVCLGDSVTGIYYHTGGRRAYPEMVAVGLTQTDPAIKLTVVNAGLSGHSTVNGIARLQKDVLDHKPDLVTVMFGLNDMVRVPLADFQTNLRTIIARCRAINAEVLLCTPNGVMESAGRPIAKLEEYNRAMKSVGEETKTPVCDVYGAYVAVREKDPLAFRLFCSDEIHPNMDGHKLNAETICEAITGKPVSLKAVGPLPAIPKTLKLIAAKQPIRVVAMTPYDQHIGAALKQLSPDAKVEVTPWPVADVSLADLRVAAKKIRKTPVDLVVLAVPLKATPTLSNPQAADIDSHSWILNDSLSFGLQEWDVIAITPSVLTPELSTEDLGREAFSKRMIWAQDLGLVSRAAGNKDDAAAILATWLISQTAVAPILGR